MIPPIYELFMCWIHSSTASQRSVPLQDVLVAASRLNASMASGVEATRCLVMNVEAVICCEAIVDADEGASCTSLRETEERLCTY